MQDFASSESRGDMPCGVSPFSHLKAPSGRELASVCETEGERVPKKISNLNVPHSPSTVKDGPPSRCGSCLPLGVT